MVKDNKIEKLIKIKCKFGCSYFNKDKRKRMINIYKRQSSIKKNFFALDYGLIGLLILNYNSINKFSCQSKMQEFKIAKYNLKNVNNIYFG